MQGQLLTDTRRNDAALSTVLYLFHKVRHQLRVPVVKMGDRLVDNQEVTGLHECPDKGDTLLLPLRGCQP